MFKFIRKIKRLMSRSTHGSCYPREPPVHVRLEPTRGPSDRSKSLLEGMKNAATAELRIHLNEGRVVHGTQDGKHVRMWKDADGVVHAEEVYDPAERAREKQASRDEDQRRLEAGEVTQEQLRQENGKFAFPSAKMLLDKAKKLS